MTRCDLCQENKKLVAKYDAPPCEGRDAPLLTKVCEKCLETVIRYDDLKVRPIRGIYQKRNMKIIERLAKLYKGKFKHDWVKIHSDSDDRGIYDLMRCEKCRIEQKRYGISGFTRPEFGCHVAEHTRSGTPYLGRSD